MRLSSCIKLLLLLFATVVLASCAKHKTEPVVKAERTILVYISGECSLGSYIQGDLEEMKAGSKSIGDNNLVVFVDGVTEGEIPWVARICNGEITERVSISDVAEVQALRPAASEIAGDPYSSDPAVLEGVIKYVFNKFPAKNGDYALSFWGHGTGWQIEDSVTDTKAYGIDNGKNDGVSNIGKWLNIPTMAAVLSRSPHLTYIFFDCCNMACLEVAYELRGVTDYVIGAPAEIPGEGAPYHTVIPAMFEKETFWKSILDKYAEQRSLDLDWPLAVIKTDAMIQLASTTKAVLQRMAPKFNGTYPDMTGLIFYLGTYAEGNEFYDANDFILKFAESADYTLWKQALDQAVIYTIFSTQWVYTHPLLWNKYFGEYFTVTKEKFGGVSMFVPNSEKEGTDNLDIQKLAWYKAAGYDTIGW